MTAKEKVLEVFFKKPTTEFHLRKLARGAKISATATLKTTRELVKEGLITKEERPPLTIYKANLEREFIQKKRMWNLEQLYTKGFVKELESTGADSAILFGSYSYGQDWEKSDIDIALIKPQKEVKIKKLEKIINKEVQVFTDTENFPETTQNNLINGIILFGRWDPLSKTISEKKSAKG